MDTFVVRPDKFAPTNLKPLKRLSWERGRREIEGRLLFTHRRNLLSLLLRSYEETGIFSHSDSSFGHHSTVHINPMGEFVAVDVLQPGRGNLNGREWISGVEFDSKGVHLASVTNTGYLSVHNYETLYCKSTSNQIKHGRKEKDFRNDTKPILHISTHEKLDAVRWNPTNQNEVGCVSERSSKILLFNMAYKSVEPSVLKREPKSSLQQNMEHIGLSDMAFSHNDESRILACGLDGYLHLWDRRASNSSCSVMSVPSPSCPFSSLELTSDEQVAIVGSKYGNVYFWDLREGRTSAALLSHKEVYRPPFTTINIGSLLGKISSLKAQTKIGSSGIQSINIDPSCQHQLAFHLSNGWSGILNLNSLKVTHMHCPAPPWIKDNSSIASVYYHKRKPAWLHTDSIYAVGSSLGNGINFLDFSPDTKSSCYVTYDSDDLQTDIEEMDGHSLNHFLQASSSVVSCAAHPLNTSIVGGTEGGSLVLIAQNSESISGEDSISDEKVKSGVHSDMS